MRILPALLLLLTASPCLAAASSPLALLASPEQSYYEKVFVYTMEVTKPGEKYDWAGYTGKGSISVEAPFVSKSGATCRNFSETFTVQGQPGNGKGIGCKRAGAEGWCKLKPGNALTCAMEQPANMFGDFSFGSLTAPSVSAPNVTVPGVNTTINAPNINAPSMPHAEVKKADNPTASAADTITSGAGQAAGSAASNGIKWFGKTFR